MMETNEKSIGRKYCGHGIWRCIGLGILGVIGFGALLILGGFVIMWLWNWLMPSIFNLTTITYWQALGLAVLARLLMGGCGHGRHGHKMHKWHRSKWGCCGENSKCSCGKDNCNCQTTYHKNAECHSDTDKWKHYDEYWKEEGEKAFDEYIKRKGGKA